MIVTKIELSNFRNYDSLSLELDDKTNILYGDNAQGKTNILESNSPNRIFPCIFHYTKSVTPSIYKLIPFSSISRQKDIVLILYACFKLRKQHQIKPQKRIIIQRNCVFPHKSCIYANQSQEIEKSFG